MEKKKTIKAWIIVQTDSEDYWDAVLYPRRNMAVTSMRQQQKSVRSGFKFLKVVPCIITYTLPKK